MHRDIHKDYNNLDTDALILVQPSWNNVLSVSAFLIFLQVITEVIKR